MRAAMAIVRMTRLSQISEDSTYVYRISSCHAYLSRSPLVAGLNLDPVDVSTSAWMSFRHEVSRLRLNGVESREEKLF